MNKENLSFVVRHKVKPGSESVYEDWLKRIVPKAASYPGHQGANILRPTKGNTNYVIVVNFANIESAKKWIESEDRKKLVDEIKEYLVTGDTTEVRSGIDFWFTPDAEKKPPGWKQWLVTTAVIAPLTMIVPPLLDPLFRLAPPLRTYGVSHTLIASMIVALVTFLIMPRIMPILHSWLYKE